MALFIGLFLVRLVFWKWPCWTGTRPPMAARANDSLIMARAPRSRSPQEDSGSLVISGSLLLLRRRTFAMAEVSSYGSVF